MLSDWAELVLLPRPAPTRMMASLCTAEHECAKALPWDASRVTGRPDTRLSWALSCGQCTDRGFVTLISVYCCSLVQMVPKRATGTTLRGEGYNYIARAICSLERGRCVEYLLFASQVCCSVLIFPSNRFAYVRLLPGLPCMALFQPEPPHKVQIWIWSQPFLDLPYHGILYEKAAIKES